MTSPTSDKAGTYSRAARRWHCATACAAPASLVLLLAALLADDLRVAALGVVLLAVTVVFAAMGSRADKRIGQTDD